jgi:hypothetical protein
MDATLQRPPRGRGRATRPAAPGTTLRSPVQAPERTTAGRSTGNGTAGRTALGPASTERSTARRATAGPTATGRDAPDRSTAEPRTTTGERAAARVRTEHRRRATEDRRRTARRRLAHVLTATVPLTELVLLVALLAFPSAPTGSVLLGGGVVAATFGGALVTVHLTHQARRPEGLAPALARGAAAGFVAATLVAWTPILGALVLVSL